MYDAVRILLIWLLCFLSVLLHELGHAMGFRMAEGKTEWKIRAGSGPEILSTKRFAFCLFPVGGYFDPRKEPGTRKAKLVTLAGGPAVTLLLAALFCACRFCLAGFMNAESELFEILSPASRFLMFYNIFLFLFTAVPMRYRVVCRGFESDGLQIVHTLKHEKAQREAPEVKYALRDKNE